MSIKGEFLPRDKDYFKQGLRRSGLQEYKVHVESFQKC